MSDPFEPDFRDGFDDLEERIHETERDKESEIKTSVRLEPFAMQLNRKIANEISTNKTTVYNKAVVEGLTKVRESLMESNRIGNLGTDYVNMQGDYYGMNASLSGDVEEGINEIEVDSDFKIGSNTMENQTLYLPDSIVSEIRDNLDNIGLSQSVFRLILVQGLSESRFANKKIEDGCESLLEEFEDSLEEARRETEEEIVKHCGSTLAVWSSGEWDGYVDELKDIADRMETDYGDEVEKLIEMA